MAIQHNIETQSSLLAALLPLGYAWPREIGSTAMSLVEGLSVEFADVEERLLEIPEETDPRSTFELIAEWERALGLPDCCVSIADTIAAKRNAIIDRYLHEGGQSRAYFQALSDDLGYTVEIDEFTPFITGISKFGTKALEGNEDIRLMWRVRVMNLPIYYFRFGLSEAGVTPLTDFARAEDLECLLNRLKPAHTKLILAYEGEV